MASALTPTLATGPGEPEMPPEEFDPLHQVYRLNFHAFATIEKVKLLEFISPEVDALTWDWRDFGSVALMNPPWARVIRRFLARSSPPAPTPDV